MRQSESMVLISMLWLIATGFFILFNVIANLNGAILWFPMITLGFSVLWSIGSDIVRSQEYTRDVLITIGAEYLLQKEKNKKRK